MLVSIAMPSQLFFFKIKVIGLAEQRWIFYIEMNKYMKLKITSDLS